MKTDRKMEGNIQPKKERTKQTRKVKLEYETSGENAKIAGNLDEVTPADETTYKRLTVTSVFQYFKELTSQEDQVRIDAALQLLQQLSKTKQLEKREKELSYTLSRLVRGCGASTNTSRAGFFTGLIAFLKVFGGSDICMDQVFKTLEKELHVGATIANKEDADAVVGKLLTCGALLHAGLISISSSEHLEKMTNILLQATKHRTYHASLGFSFLLELLESLSETQFEAIVWPTLQKYLSKPWSNQTLQTVHCLIATKRKFPSVVNAKYLKAHFGGGELLNPSSYQALFKIFWENSNTNILTHPAFENFGTYIGSNKKLSEFWIQTVDPSLHTPTKLLEFETLKIATDVLNNLSTEKTNIVDLLSHNFMRMIVGGLRNLKQKKDETLKAFYNEFLDALVTCCSKKGVTDTQRVDVIRRLLLPPGTFNIEKYTTTRVVHQLINGLSEEGVVKVYELYKSIFLATIPKNSENPTENWLNFERQNAGYMLQHLLTHKSVARAYSWRAKQLQFFFTCGVFYVNDAASEVCKKDASGEFSKDFGEQCKNMFYSCLKSKLTDLREECQLLLKLVHFCNERLQHKHASKYFRVKHCNDKLQQAWTSLYAVLIQSDEKVKKPKEPHSRHATLKLVFHILLANMGLQLFREPDMAIPAVEDLLKCMQRTKKQWKLEKIHKTNECANANTEPEWIEVLVDLFLNFLSHNASDLRNIVNALFPHLCANLNLSAVHQILAMLDMKDGQNPLTAKGVKEEEGDQDDDQDSDGEELELGNGIKRISDEDSDNSNEDEEDDDEDDEAEEGEVMTKSDKLRNAISQALLETGAAVGQEDDMNSVDLNDINEEDGKKLDEALGNAFKAIKKTNEGAQQKKSKSYRFQTTSLMHFRIRVLDLIEIYLQQSPTLIASIEIMLVLYDMLQFCVGDELKPLQGKVQKVLTKLTTIKTYTCDGEIKEDNLVDFIRLILGKKAPAAAFDMTNKLRNKCIVFLINCAKKVAGSETVPSQVLAFCQDAVMEFVNSRNPIMNITLLSEIFKLRWSGVWTLAVKLAQQGISMLTRTFRRIQIYEILAVLYKNIELLRDNQDISKKELKQVEKPIVKHIQLLDSSASAKLSAREFQTLLELMLRAQHANKKLELSSSLLLSSDTCDQLQNLRRKLKLESTQLYHRFCAAFKLQVIRNNEVCESENNQNGSQQKENDDGECEDELDTEDNKTTHEIQKTDELIKAQKRKNYANDVRKEKKLKKQQRMRDASSGLNGGIKFVTPGESSDENQ